MQRVQHSYSSVNLRRFGSIKARSSNTAALALQVFFKFFYGRNTIIAVLNHRIPHSIPRARDAATSLRYKMGGS